MNKTCFVIMAIGDQEHDGIKVSSGDLKAKYNDLIKEALLRADPSLEITRADDISAAGSINDDIVAQIMYSDLVIVDITYPNPNVYYELGLRHAFKPGTIIIRQRGGTKVPFDIADLRYIEYDDTSSGLKELSRSIKSYISGYNKEPDRPDNKFLTTARFQKLKSFDYSESREMPMEVQLMMSMMGSPEIMDIFQRQSNGEDIDQYELMQVMAKNPEIAIPLFTTLSKSGQLSFMDSKDEDNQK